MITSTSNPKVKYLASLMKKRKLRDEEGIFLVEGIRMFREVPSERLREVYLSESFCEKERELSDRLCDRNGDIPVEILSDRVFAHVSDTKTPQGILCLVKRREHSVKEMLAGENPFLLVLDNLQDPGNLGTMIRTAEAAGVTGVILSRDSVDLYNPKTIRSTMGSVYRMPVCYVEDLPGVLGMLSHAGVTSYAAHLDGKHSYDEEDYRSPCAFLIGNEGNGLRDDVAARADTYIRIPMQGQVESLNAATAATVLMFEASRQRRRK